MWNIICHHTYKYQNCACEDWASAGLILRSRLWRESRVGGPRWVLKTESADLIHFAAAIRVRLTFQRVSWILRKRARWPHNQHSLSHRGFFPYTFHWTLMPVLVQFKFRASAESSLFFSIALSSLSLCVCIYAECDFYEREQPAGRALLQVKSSATRAAAAYMRVGSAKSNKRSLLEVQKYTMSEMQTPEMW